MDSAAAATSLKEGLDSGCADDITEALCNLSDGTCDAVELIPLLERVAEKDQFRYFDDNGAGGLPHPTGKAVSFAGSAREAIENIRRNGELESPSPIARSLKSLDTQTVETALRQLVDGDSTDETLLPILEKIARKNTYSSYSYFRGYDLPPVVLGDTARRAIQRVRENVIAAGNAGAKCTLCGNIPDMVTVNTGREEYFGAPITSLKRHRLDATDEIWECQRCGALFRWHDDSSWTGSGNNDSEVLTRLSPGEASALRRDGIVG